MKWDRENLLTIGIFPVMLRAGVEQTLRMLAIFQPKADHTHVWQMQSTRTWQ